MMLATVDTLTRQQKIEQYVVRDALETFVANFFEGGGYAAEDGAPIEEPNPDVDGLAREEVQDILVELGNALMSELWPEEEDLHSQEYLAASSKSAALVARWFAELAAMEPDWAARRAAWWIGRVVAGS